MPARWIVFAYHTFGARALRALLADGQQVMTVVTHTDDPSEGSWFESVADVAREHAIPVLMPPSPNVPKIFDCLRAMEPDVFLSVWYRRLLGPELLAMPRIAALNLHGSLLPAYRGRAPVNWVLVNGETRTGVTLHHMTEDADAGDIVAQAAIDIAPDDTALSLYHRIVDEGVELLLKAYSGVLDGSAPRTPQDHTRASVYGRRRAEDGRIAWEWPATRIAGMIRAVTHPYPGAFAGDGDARLILWAGEALARPSVHPPGTVLEIVHGTGITVATGDGVLLVKRVQGAGLTQEPADVWAFRCAIAPGTRL
jgi:UDP-4-amino-4-deoxy-L-arabinose formyltransferase/UDP-glucuronic acid dehydrogenase (UDP-4-keto-hexauronic acid decarboxylating)